MKYIHTHIYIYTHYIYIYILRIYFVLLNSIDHLRPEGRIKKDNGHWSTACQLEPDKTAFWLKLPSASETTTTATAVTDKGKNDDIVIAVEIKPKGAVMPVGTLVPPGNNRLKYRVARFDAQQRFKAQVIIMYPREVVAQKWVPLLI